MVILMTEEQKRYEYQWDSEKDFGIDLYHGKVITMDDSVDRLNAYEYRVKELEQAIDKAIDNINCDASEAAMRPLIELMEGK